jgi:hypothetical protein
LVLAAMTRRLATEKKRSNVVLTCACGAGAAFAAITRAESQVILLLISSALIIRPQLRPARPAGWAIVIGIVLALGAWGTRNALALGRFHVGSTHDGKTLFESNCASTIDGIRDAGVVGGFLERCSDAQLRHATTLSEIDADRQLTRDALMYIASHPMDAVHTAGFKAVVSLTGFDFRSPVLSLRNVGAIASNVLLLALAATGLWQLRREVPRAPHVSAFWIICAATAAVTLVTLSIGPTGLRYRMGMTGFLYIGAAAQTLRFLRRTRLQPWLLRERALRAISS